MKMTCLIWRPNQQDQPVLKLQDLGVRDVILYRNEERMFDQINRRDTGHLIGPRSS